MTPEAIAAHLYDSMGHFTELDQIVATFSGYRETREGASQHVRIEILDGGERGHPMYRYNARIHRDDGKMVTGNGARTLDEALSIVHWEELDAA